MIRLNKRQSPYAIFLQYSVFTCAFMTMVFTVILIYFVTVLELVPLQMLLVGTALELSILCLRYLLALSRTQPHGEPPSLLAYF